MSTKRLLVVGLVLVFALIVRPVRATPLAPGASVLPTSFGTAPGVLLATTTAPFTSALGASDFSGVVTEDVYLDGVTGFMDFVYQFHNNAASGQAIEQMSDSIFTGFTTDVQFDPGAGFNVFTSGASARLVPIEARAAAT